MVKSREISLGLRENWRQFTVLVLTVGFVGSLVGLERTVVPLIGETEFGLTSKTAILSFLVTFGVVKAFCNLVSSHISEKLGRKRILVLGWLIGLPLPLIIIYATHWIWIDVANILLGINQALTWSMTVIMKIDLVGPKRRGLALGLNEFAGYIAVGTMAWLTGEIASRYSLRPEPFYIGIAIAVAGLLVSAVFVRETIDYARYEASLQEASEKSRFNPVWKPSLKETFLLTTWKEKALSSCSQAGLVNNLNDGMSWGLYPLYFSSFGLEVAAIGVIKAVYPMVWGVLQPLTGPMSDRVGLKWLIAGGMAVQAVGIWMVVLLPAYGWWIVAAALQGLGTAMVYPVLLASISDVAHPTWRASSLGVYRFWRDLGYAVGALVSGLIADTLGMGTAISVIGAMTIVSGLIVMFRMYETLLGKGL